MQEYQGYCDVGVHQLGDEGMKELSDIIMTGYPESGIMGAEVQKYNDTDNNGYNDI